MAKGLVLKAPGGSLGEGIDTHFPARCGEDQQGTGTGIGQIRHRLLVVSLLSLCRRESGLRVYQRLQSPQGPKGTHGRVVVTGVSGRGFGLLQAL